MNHRRPLYKQVNRKQLSVVLVVIYLVLPLRLLAQSDSTGSIPRLDEKIKARRITAIAGGTTILYGSFLVAASQAWYKDMPRTRFHFFNDYHEWQQVDKAGHFWSAYHESQLAMQALKWAGIQENSAIWWGSMAGILIQTPIEILDGFAVDYGASTGDLLANTAGSIAMLAQYKVWQESRIIPKFSFHTTRFARVRPNVLGNTLPEEILKDYNGQTYWLAVEVARFLPKPAKYPKWMNIAIGYGTEEMVYNDPDTNRQAGFRAYRQFYLAPDLNLTAFKTRSKFLNTTLYILNMVHIPMPTLEFNSRQKLKLHALYF